MQRLKARGQSKDRYLIANPYLIMEREERYDAMYDVFKGRKAMIDTTGRTVEESAKQLIEIISKNIYD